MSVLPIPGLRFIGNMPDQTTLVPNRSYPSKEAGNRDYTIRSIPPPPKLLNNAIQPSSLRKVLGKSNFSAIIIGRAKSAPSTDGMYPKQGIARNEQKGLAYEIIPGKKIDGPIMPLADSRFAFLNSKLN